MSNEIRHRYIKEAEEAIRQQVSGFSVPETEIGEAAFYTAKAKWERDGYEFDTESSFVSVNQREKDILNKVFHEFLETEND